MTHKVSEIKVSYKQQIPAPFRQKISCSKDAAKLLFEYWDHNTIALHESFNVLLLNRNNRVKGIYELSKGGITGTLVDIRILFGVVIKTLSVGIILTHNHPSGTLKASETDKQITNKVKMAAEIFELQQLSH